MTQPASPLDFLDCSPDKRLLDDEMGNLPLAEQRQWKPQESHTRARLVAIGATVTGITLIGGVALIATGVIRAISNGITAFDLTVAVLGGVALATHWGWVHAAEATADSIERRRGGEDLAERLKWLETVEPYTRYSIATDVLADGSIRITRWCHHPVLTSVGTFTFARERQAEEVHAGEGTGVEVAERAEALRRLAALDTERERERWELAADAYETIMLDGDDEQRRLAARRAVALALSEQINSNLRRPPLVE